jgi:hypothetical protein
MTIEITEIGDIKRIDIEDKCILLIFDLKPDTPIKDIDKLVESAKEFGLNCASDGKALFCTKCRS